MPKINKTAQIQNPLKYFSHYIPVTEFIRDYQGFFCTKIGSGTK